MKNTKFQIIDQIDFNSLRENTDPKEVLNDVLDYYGRPSLPIKDLDTFVESLIEEYVENLDSDNSTQEYNNENEVKDVGIEKVLSELSTIVSESINVVYTYITYPLGNPAIFRYEMDLSDEQLTVGDLLWIYSKSYQKVYEIEESDDCNPGYIPGMLNRANSNGRFKIWGHVLTDLVYNGRSEISIYDDFVVCVFNCDT